MSSEFIPQQASCSCYSNTYTINNKPIGRFICHCTICQEFTGQAYNDVTILLKSDVSELKLINTKFRRWKLPPNISRGLCTRCNKPSIEMAVGGNLILVPTANYLDGAALPEPTMHLFYNRRVEDMDDNLPKYNGFVQSQTMMVKALTQGMYKRVNKR
ncbi:GFA family protein [Psychrobacter sp. 72-O-c]|uniref:GFA family protein n=1 Tax=Psychrobacter sp. 72-O-c TaxID=2774125 RepID=UPI00191B308D|nr:GFA family protein [Psychrobacter sp. 72-O-c]